MVVEMAQFEKISFEQFKKDCQANLTEQPSEERLRKAYDDIKLPKQATAGSAGHDFMSLCQFTLAPGQSLIIPTGIKVFMEPGWFLAIYPRSSLGFKYKAKLDNTVGIIDLDYYNNPKNEGHVMVKISNCGDQVFTVNPGDRFVQGIFQPYGVVYGSKAEGTRTGGFGSTDENK